MSNTVNINGKVYQGGNSIIVSNNRVIIDGKDITDDLPETKEFNIQVNGNVESLKVDAGTVTVSGSVGDLKATSGNITCGDVTGNVKNMSGNIKCGSIAGNAETMSGNIRHQ